MTSIRVHTPTATTSWDHDRRRLVELLLDSDSLRAEVARSATGAFSTEPPSEEWIAWRRIARRVAQVARTTEHDEAVRAIEGAIEKVRAELSSVGHS